MDSAVATDVHGRPGDGPLRGPRTGVPVPKPPTAILDNSLRELTTATQGGRIGRPVRAAHSQSTTRYR